MNLIIITLEFNQSLSSGDLTPSAKDFYDFVVRDLTSGIDGPIDSVEHRSVPIDTGLDRFDILQALKGILAQAQSETTVYVVDAYSWAGKTDLDSIKKIPELVSNAVEQIPHFQMGGSKTACLLLSKTPPREDVGRFEQLDALSKSHNFFVIDSQGELIGKQHIVTNYDPSTLQDRVRRAFAYSISDIQKKIIDRVGMFQINGLSGNSIVHHFYDCAEAVQEIAYVLSDRIRTANEHDAQATERYCVVFLELGSYWAAQTSLELRRILGNRSPDIGYVEYSKDSISDIPHDCTTVFLVVPFLEKGTTIKKLNEEILEHDSSIKVINVAVLTSMKVNDENLVVLDSDATTVECLVEVEKRRELKIDRTASEILGYRPISTDTYWQPSGRLSSISFWMMVHELGFEFEDNVPSNRNALGYIPKLREMISRNSKFFAHEIKALMHSQGRVASRLLVAPEEPTAAPILSKAILELHNVQTVLIPRDVLNAAAKRDIGELKGFLREAFEDRQWFLNLSEWKRKNYDRPVFVLDEISVSGGTYEAIKMICHSFDIKVSSQLVAINFDGLEGATGDTRSLYQIEFGVEKINEVG